ncbi:MAG: hypothetical protein WAX89_08175, partial [Alphaproteobacteria bacterium]
MKNARYFLLRAAILAAAIVAYVGLAVGINAANAQERGISKAEVTNSLKAVWKQTMYRCEWQMPTAHSQVESCWRNEARALDFAQTAHVKFKWLAPKRQNGLVLELPLLSQYGPTVLKYSLRQHFRIDGSLIQHMDEVTVEESVNGVWVTADINRPTE